ncbi:Tc toxin subunit A-related protein [Paenibacillus glycanilyticus]|uniref:Tc toxin subunit A-related protein n=1 Tax=Paenibacillus glycanilyticus TaxID=126569 RepID=UPI000FD82FE5|nr:insecticidal toxin protein [Paenibacillus glycanilyticus]
MAGLQAADTDYVKNNDGTYQTLPFSFQIALPNGLALQLPRPGQPTEIEPITLQGSVTVAIPDGVEVRLVGGLKTTLPGSVIATDQQRGIRVVHQNGTAADLEIGDVVILESEKVKVALPEAILIIGEDGQLRRLTEPGIVELPVGTNIKLLGGKPRPKLYREIFTETQYSPTDLVQQPYPVRDLDFTSSGAYSVYNWELFYHIPIAAAIHLSKNQRYEEAQRWFHFIFDPTDSSDGATPERFWKVQPFQYTEVKQIEEILVNLSAGTDSALQNDTINSIGAWKDSPFRPHLIARYRHTAYMYKAVMAYLDNLIAWGDDLFRQDTGEAINEATQIYVLAALILGDRPQAVPKKGSLAPLTYASARGKWDEFGNTLEKMESEIPFDLAPLPMTGGAIDQFATLSTIGTSLHFCVPRNDKMMSYWDTVADRLFKIRNSLNLQGIFRQLPLFEPPIDPALLARAAAAGLDIGAVIAGINQPLPLVRYQLLVQKAGEICQEVKSLGNSLLSAMEKEDNEALSILRARHEKVILGLAETVKYAQWQETIKNREGLETSLFNAAQRYIYYERMLGKPESEIAIPGMDALDADSFEKFKFKSSEPEVVGRTYEVDIAQDLGESGGKIVSSYEAEELDKSSSSRMWHDIAKASILLGEGLSVLPDFNIDFHFWGLGGHATKGGTDLSRTARLAADLALEWSDHLNYQAGRAAKIGNYARREQDWLQQSNTAAGEINQIFKQLRAAQIRENIAEREWRNHQQQIKHSQEIEDFLTNEKNGKKTTQAFYAWLKREVRGLYAQVFQFAFDVAKKAECALQHELGKPDLTFLQYGYMSGKEGLLAGEKLYFDLKRMEMAYHELNKREYELTKHISLIQVNPLALIELRTTGRTTIQLPEALFDMDGPGHYFRRIKSVAISIPCVAGPYTSVNCSLILTKSSIRKEVGVGDGYARLGTEDSRFSDYYGSTQAIVTSTAQNDSGMFETNLRDERYLPFENMGAISEWELELPTKLRQFEYDTISDVILHLRYTAREGGGSLRREAENSLNSLAEVAQAPGSVRLFSVRHEFPVAWANLQSQQPSDTKRFELEIRFKDEHYPFWSRDRHKRIERVEILARSKTENPLPPIVEVFENGSKNTDKKKGMLVAEGSLYRGILSDGLPAAPVGDWSLYFNTKSMSDMWIALTWSST